jgi:hypothetical protein
LEEDAMQNVVVKDLAAAAALMVFAAGFTAAAPLLQALF